MYERHICLVVRTPDQAVINHNVAFINVYARHRPVHVIGVEGYNDPFPRRLSLWRQILEET